MARSYLSAAFWMACVFLFCIPLTEGWAQQPTSEGPQEELFEAAKVGDIRGVRQALADGADINAKDNGGKIPLDYAGNADVVKVLLDHGADVNAKDNDGWTPLHDAAAWGHADVVKVLLDHGADVNAKDNDGWTPLHDAAAWGHADVAKVLLDHGAGVSARDNHSRTPLDVTKAPEMAELLESYVLLQSAALAEQEKEGDLAMQQGKPREALDHFLDAFKRIPQNLSSSFDMPLRKKIINCVLQLNPPPAIPQEAIRHASYAEAAVEEAQKDANPSHLNDAVSETEKALRVAPWWAQGYFSLAALLEKTNQPGDAANALQFYLLADPKAAIAQKNGMNAQDVQVKIYKLQYEAKQQQ